MVTNSHFKVVSSDQCNDVEKEKSVTIDYKD